VAGGARGQSIRGCWFPRFIRYSTRGGHLRRLSVILLIVLVSGLASSVGSAHASARWPARCRSFKCVNAHMNQLHKQVKAANARVSSVIGFLNNCLVVDPITQYVNYLANDNTTTLSAVDFTHSGDSIDLWAVGIDPGTCGLGTTAIRSNLHPLAKFHLIR
jgi:hypothetical protein